MSDQQCSKKQCSEGLLVGLMFWSVKDDGGHHFKVAVVKNIIMDFLMTQFVCSFFAEIILFKNSGTDNIFSSSVGVIFLLWTTKKV
jgi:hypothetical protein